MHATRIQEYSSRDTQGCTPACTHRQRRPRPILAIRVIARDVMASFLSHSPRIVPPWTVAVCTLHAPMVDMNRRSRFLPVLLICPCVKLPDGKKRPAKLPLGSFDWIASARGIGAKKRMALLGASKRSRERCGYEGSCMQPQFFWPSPAFSQLATKTQAP